MSLIETHNHETEADAVAELARQAVAPEILPVEGTVAALAGAGGSVKVVDLEQYDAHPRRATADRFVYDAGSFASYLHRHEGPATEVYADVQAARVVAILDSHEAARDVTATSGTPGWQQHRITLQLTKSPSWLAWEKHDGDFLPQSEFAEFAELQAADVREPSPADLLDLAQQMEVTKGVAWEGGQRLADGQTRISYKETVEAKAGARGDLEIPSTLRLALKPYIGGPTYAVVARFRYRLRGQNLVLGYVLERPDISYDPKDKVWRVVARSGGGKALPWEAYTESLCKARVVSEVGRDGAQDLFFGAAYTAEELGHGADGDDGGLLDITTTSRDITPPVTADEPVDAEVIDDDTGEVRPAPTRWDPAVWEDRIADALGNLDDLRTVYKDARAAGVLTQTLSNGETVDTVVSGLAQRLQTEQTQQAEAPEDAA